MSIATLLTCILLWLLLPTIVALWDAVLGAARVITDPRPAARTSPADDSDGDDADSKYLVP